MVWQPQPIVPPWKGIVTDLPALMAPPTSFNLPPASQVAIGNFWIDKQRLKCWPFSSAMILPPNGEPIYGARSFLDAVGNTHTVFMTPDQLYYWTGSAYDKANIALVGSSSNTAPRPFSSDVFQNVLYAANGWGYPQGIDGSANSITLTDASPAGTAFFVGKLAGRLLLLNLTEPLPGVLGSANYGRRFRWSMVNNAQNWTDYTAGVADIPECEDVITGYAMQGPMGYVYRTNGITILTPTGNISPTFYIEQYVSGPVGIGCYYPYCLGQYGDLTVFPSQDDIYSFNPQLGPPQGIGGSAREAIFLDLNNAQGFPTGTLIPNWSAGVVNLIYCLSIPLPISSQTYTKLWLYSFESQTWMYATYPYGSMTCIANVAVM